MRSIEFYAIFDQSIADYHIKDSVDTHISNPYSPQSFEYLLYLKNWIDTVQWHYEDIIRIESIDPAQALVLKRKIDASNQHRTDVVEYIDSWFLDKYQNVAKLPQATINTESPAWAIDRLSILALKIYHMRVEANRKDASQDHKDVCSAKLDVLLEQKKDLCEAIDQLIFDISEGKKYMKVYKQMKMYNDPALNPELYAKR